MSRDLSGGGTRSQTVQFSVRPFQSPFDGAQGSATNRCQARRAVSILAGTGRFRNSDPFSTEPREGDRNPGANVLHWESGVLSPRLGSGVNGGTVRALPDPANISPGLRPSDDKRQHHRSLLRSSSYEGQAATCQSGKSLPHSKTPCYVPSCPCRFRCRCQLPNTNCQLPGRLPMPFRGDIAYCFCCCRFAAEIFILGEAPVLPAVIAAVELVVGVHPAT